MFADEPFIILELNKILPKCNRLPHVDADYGIKLLNRLKSTDEAVFGECMKALLSYKNLDITIDNLIVKLEEILADLPDSLDDFLLFLDYKRVDTTIPNKKQPEPIQPEVPIKKAKMNQNLHREREKEKEREYEQEDSNLSIQQKQKSLATNYTKSSGNPDYLFFDSLKKIMDESSFKILIKQLHLYVEGVLSYHEFVILVEPSFSNNVEYFEYLKQIAYSKMMNRRHTSLINKPLSELDLTKSRRICTSYSEIPKQYPNLICSGRTEFHFSILNDKYISIPCGSEDDKNPLKKNHYEENLFKFEEQRYDIDMSLEYLKYSTEKLQTLLDKVDANSTNIDLEEELGNTVIRYIGKSYKEHADKLLESLKTHPMNAIPIVLTRFKKRIEEVQNTKLESEKTIKPQYEKFYLKSLDYRSLRFKNNEKKNNNAKAFVKEITQRKKDKLTTNNINILRGGVENFEFYITINLKFFKENIAKTLKEIEELPVNGAECADTESNNAICNSSNLNLEAKSDSINAARLDDNFNFTTDILMKNIYKLDEIDLNDKKKLPEFRMIIDNQEYFKLTLSLIFYSIYFSSIADSYKIAEYFSLFINNIFNIDTTKLLENLYDVNKNLYKKDSEVTLTQKNESNGTILDKIDSAIEEIKIESAALLSVDLKIFNDKDLNYTEVLEQLKNKNTESLDLDKFYNIDKLANLIDFKKEIISSISNKLTSEFESVLSLTPSLESQESGKTYKDLIIMDESRKEEHIIKNHLFLPPKNKANILFYTNEHYYVLIRYIFCIYERLNKLGDSSAGLDFFSQNTSENIERKANDMTLLKNFVTIYKAFVHKKIENSNAYEEFCRDILGNESYFLLNIDKLINSLIKSLSNMNNDKNCIEVIELFLNEKARKYYTNENLYYSNFVNLMENYANANCFRILYSPREKIMTFHSLDLSSEINRKDYFENYSSLMDANTAEPNQCEDSNESDEIFNLYLKRNKRLMENKRKNVNPIILENNLIFRLDATCKKFQFLKSGSDTMFYKKKPMSEVEKLKRTFLKNLKFRLYTDNKINKFVN